jgi:acyl-CoA synthetase (AMP-forming)/AMP-acid ligase II
VPRICLLSTPVARSVHDAFLERYGIPLRQTYSSSETGAIAVDAGPADEVVPGTVGQVIDGVDVCIGDHPSEAVGPGRTGRIWVRSPWLMAGYGVPPTLDRPGEVDGWWPTRDLGSFDRTGRLTLAGRIDDCVRTRDGRLVNLEAVASMLRAIPSVRAAMVVPLEGASGASFGAVLQCDPGATIHSVRTELTTVAPPWALPRRIELLPELPRLPSGKPDRQACLSILNGGVMA